MTRINPRRYSAVKNIAPTTASAISPMNSPARLCFTVTVGYGPPGPGIGAISPDPVTVNTPLGCSERGPVPPAIRTTGPPPPTAVPVHQLPDATPVTATWSNTPVAWPGLPVDLDPPNDVDVRVWFGEVANIPI